MTATKNKAAPKAGRVYRVKIDGTYYPVEDATQDVTIPRKLMHIWKGKRGEHKGCMNLECILANKESFPHPVLAASVIKTRVYIFDTPEHVVRYTLSHADQEGIGKHDAIGIGSTGMLTLHKPVGQLAAGTVRGIPGRPEGQKTGVLRKTVNRGAKARIAAVVGAANE